jgi:hypothetical protein
MAKSVEKPASKNSYPSDEQEKFMLRLPLGMRDKVKAAAAKNNRSMNAEIVALLQEKYPVYDATSLVGVVRKLFPMSSEKRADMFQKFDTLGSSMDKAKHDHMVGAMKAALANLDNMNSENALEIDDILIQYWLFTYNLE